MGYIGNQPAEKFSSFSKQTFSPDGSTTSFTLDYAVSGENELALFVNNVRQEPGSGKAYTASGTTLTMSEAPGSSDTMYGIFIGKAVQTVTPAASSVTNDMLTGSIESSKLAFASYPYRNLIINGDMSIAQRGTSVSSITSSGYRTVDRFYHNVTSMGTWTLSQSTDVPTGQGFAKSVKWDCTTADASPTGTDRIMFQQFIEGQNLQMLKKGTSSAESVTLSFWVKSNKTGTYIAELRDTDNSRHISKAYTISASNTWEKKTITYDGDTTGTLDNDNNTSLRLNFWLGTSSSFSSGTLATSWSSYADANRAVGQVNLADNTANEWYITGVQLEVGTSASDFEFLPYDVNLQRCQRYFEILSIKQASQENEIMNMISFNASQIYGTYQFRVEKRNDPSLVVDNGTNYFRYYRQGGYENFSSIGLDNSSLHQASLYGTGLSLTSGEGGFVRWVNNASTNDKIAFDSEL